MSGSLAFFRVRALIPQPQQLDSVGSEPGDQSWAGVRSLTGAWFPGFAEESLVLETGVAKSAGLT